MPSTHEHRLTKLEERSDNRDEKIDDMADDICGIALNVEAIRIAMARTSGVRTAVHYIVNLGIGLIGVTAGILGFGKHGG